MIGEQVSESPPVTFGGLLRSLRIAAGLTQEELAEAAKVSYRSVSDLERGISKSPRRDTTRLLSEALGLSGDDRAAFEAAARGRTSVAGHVASQPLPAGIAAARTLPRDIASFTGREQEIDSLLKAVMDPGAGDVAGICAIGGMAGVGKTALAVHVAHRLAGSFADGQIFLQLHGHTPGQRPVHPADALASLLQASGIPAQYIPDGLESRAWLWRDRLAGKRILLVLDDAARHEQVRPLLPASPGTLVLVTSRKHLTALEDARVISLDTLPAEDAVALLVRLALRRELDPDDADVQEIARLCGYLPLAIGMLARQLQHHPAWAAADLAGELAAARDRLALMTAENLSVAAAFDLSHRDLSQDEQRIFRYLGLHPGTDLDAYAAAALAGCELADARHHMAALYDHYLLREPRRGRFQMHDLIAEHSRSLAAAEPAGDRDAAIDRLLGYYLHTTRIAGRHLARRTSAGPLAVTERPPACSPDFATPADSAAWLDAEQVNLRAATIYAASHGQAGYAIELASALHGYLRHHGNWPQVIALHEIALSAARGMGNPHAEANALTDIADIYYLMGELSAAFPVLDSAIALHGRHGNMLGLANALTILGYVQCLSGQHQAARETLTGALERYTELGDNLGRAGALAYMSIVHLELEDYSAAEADLNRAQAIHQEQGGIVEAGLFLYLGVSQGSAGNHQAAMASLAQALELQRAVSNPHGEMQALAYLALTQHEAGEFEESAASLDGAMRLSRLLATPQGKSLGRSPLGNKGYRMRVTLESAADLKHAIHVYESLGLRQAEAEARNSLGENTLESGNPHDAYGQHERALVIATEAGSALEKARSLEGMGRCLLRQGERREAQARFREALAIYEGLGAPRASELRKILPE